MDLAWRLLEDEPSEAAYNMAVDEALLSRAGERPTLRLYAWSAPSVSLGRFQAWDEAAAWSARGLPLVRRATGGGAILHRDEITFAVAAPLSALGGAGAKVEAAFFAVNRALAAGLALLGVEVDAAGDARREAPPAEAPFLCFERRSRTDITFRGKKLVGSAQRRAGSGSGACVLQHGSLPLGLEAEQADAPRPVTLREAAGRAVSCEEAARAIAEGFRRALAPSLAPGALTDDERALVRSLEETRAGAGSWTARR